VNRAYRSRLFLSVSLVGILFGTPSQAWALPSATTTILTMSSGGTAIASGGSVASGSVVTLTATVKAGSTGVTVGQVNFCDASVSYCTDIHLLGTAQSTNAGTAVMKFRPGIGSHSYKAVFVGTKTDAGSASGASALAVTGKYLTTTTIAQSGGTLDYALTVTVGGAGSTAPTGTVSFVNTSLGNTVFGTAMLGTSSANLGFLNSDNPAAGNYPTAIAVADFNGDGIPDMAVANDHDGTVTILLGNGNGTFEQAASSPITVGSSPSSIAVGDFNGDGVADLAVAQMGGSVTILLGNGNGTFTEASGSPIAFSDAPDCVVVGDFNGDGKADLAVIGANEAESTSSSLAILLGNGNGTFTPVSGGPITINDDSISMALADFNGDGNPDLAVAGSSFGGVTVLLGNGNGTFTETSASPILPETPASGVAAADFNRDGKIDLAVSEIGGTSVSIMLGNGDGTFTQASGSPVAVDLFPWTIDVGDFNGDGIPDLVASDDLGPAVLEGNGDGTFELAPATTTAEVDVLAVSDFNGDGLSDLAGSNIPNTTVTVLLAQLGEATATLSGVSLTDAAQNQVDASYSGDSNYGPSVSETTLLRGVIATPVISPATGTITSAQSITITDTTPGTTIYYMAYGAFATNGVVQYTGPIPMTGSGTLNIQAYATATGYNPSQTAYATYTLNFPAAAATPVISLAPGSYAGAQTLTISDTTPGAQIYYTTDGAYPTNLSNLYSGQITVSMSEVVVAIAIAPGYSNSAFATAQYFIDSSSSRFIYTIAGTDTPGYTGDGGAATLAEVQGLQDVAVDSAGNVYMADSGDNVVRKVAAGTGIITTIAGTGVAGHTGDNGPAVSAELWAPGALAVDPKGNLFVGETGDNVVRRIDAVTGTITTFAGNPTVMGIFGGPATSFPLSSINGLACDHLGNLYILQSYYVAEVIAASGNISQIVVSTGNASPDFSGIAVDSGQNIYVSGESFVYGEFGAVWKISAQGVTTVFAGGVVGAFGGDGGVATSAGLYFPAGLAVDASGNVYIADSLDYALREVNTSGIINTIAGVFSDTDVSYGDGNPATDVFLYPQNIAIDTTGNLYLANFWLVREVTAPAAPPAVKAAAPVFSLATGTYSGPQTLIMTDATPGAEIYVSLNGVAVNTGDQGYHGPIAITGTVTVQAIAVAPGYLASAPISATYTITAAPPAVISTVAGNGTSGFLGAGGPAISAEMKTPQTVAFDGAGNLYIADTENYVVWMVAASTGNITIVAGTGTPGYGGAGDGGPATAAGLSSPAGVALDKLGNLYIADPPDGRIRMVSVQTGIITTVAGPGVDSNLGDGGPATSAYLGNPQSLTFDTAGNLYIATIYPTGRIRIVAASTGIISTVAGGGTAGQPGDGGLATAAYLAYPSGVALDNMGNIYISDGGSARVRKVEAATGVITTFAGTGIGGTTGDGGPANAAETDPEGIAVDGAGSVYISGYPDTIRKVDATTGIISTIAGDGYFGYGGDGGAATMAELYSPQGLALDSAGDLYIADYANYVVRKVTFNGRVPAITWPAPAAITYGTPLSAAQLDATSTVAGTFAYTPAAGTVLSAGTQTLSVTLTPTDTKDYITATATVTLTVNRVTPTVTVTPSASSITTNQALTVTVVVNGGSGNPAPSGTVILSSGTYTSAAISLAGGSAQINVSAGSLAAGSDKLTASYTPDSNSSSSYNTATGISSAVKVSLPPSFILAPSAGTLTVVQGSSSTDTITVTAANGFSSAVTLAASGLPSGVTASFGTNPATGSSVLALTASSTATLGGPTTVTITGTSGSLTETTTVALAVNAAPTFVVGGGSSSLSIVAGATTGNTVAITLTPSNGFTGTVTLTCSIAPVGASDSPTCTLTPSSVTITGTGAQNATLTIFTTASTSAKNQLRKLLWPSAGTALALLLFGIPRRRSNWLTMLAVLALVVSFGATSCGGGAGSSGSGGGGGSTGTSPGTYTVTVTGTSGTITGTVGTVTLTVQ
jgi:sugar lactone lactonase YvrE